MKEEKKRWLALKKLPPEMPSPLSEGDPAKVPEPDESLLDPEEAKMLQFLTQQASSFGRFRSQTQSRLQDLQSSLEFKIDHLAGSVHKLGQRVATARREADRVLGLSAARLKEREDKEKASVGTKDMPVMEVLRSLGKILPEGGA